jgi:hypothetical protein
MGMSQSFPDDRPVIQPCSRYIIALRRPPPRAMMLGDLILDDPDAGPLDYGMPCRWNAPSWIGHAREAFADYCRRRGL